MQAGQFFTITVAILILGALSGCNTAEGFGEDLESLGKSMQSTASDTTSNSKSNNTQKGNTQADREKQGDNNKDEASTRFNRWQPPERDATQG